MQPTNSRLIPLYLTQCDRIWIESAVEVYTQYIGRSFREVRASLAQAEFYLNNLHKCKFVDCLLQEAFIKLDCATGKKARSIREELFLAAARPNDSLELRSRETIIRKVCQHLDLPVSEIADLMFADIKAARKLSQPATPIDPDDLRLKANLKMVQSLFLSADSIIITMQGRCRPLIQCAKWLGLICSIFERTAEKSFTMEISGPMSVLIYTRIYGHALGRLVPFLGLAENFTCEAMVRQNHQLKKLVLRQGDPIFPKEGVKKFDSLLEKKFYESFLKATDDWNLTREPDPLISGERLVFPDFALRHRVRPDLTWYLEIIGFWTGEYLREKINSYSQVTTARLILCINAKFRPQIEELPLNAKIVWFKTVIKPSAVLAVIDSL